MFIRCSIIHDHTLSPKGGREGKFNDILTISSNGVAHIKHKVDSRHLFELLWRSSGGPKGQQAEHHNCRNTTTCMRRNTSRKPCNSFFMVDLASGMDRGRMPLTTTLLCNMVTILQLIGRPRHATLVYSLHLRYWISMLWSTETCQNKVSADQYHVTILWTQV